MKKLMVYIYIEMKLKKRNQIDSNGSEASLTVSCINFWVV